MIEQAGGFMVGAIEAPAGCVLDLIAVGVGDLGYTIHITPRPCAQDFMVRPSEAWCPRLCAAMAN